MAMKGRGQDSFIRLPNFAASLYGRMTRTRAIDRQYREIAAELASLSKQGKLLDIGTGPGWMLLHLHQLNHQLQLFGLDISRAMVNLARQNLADIPAEIRLGDIEHSGYAEAEFDIVTCNGSFYLWDQPVACLNEIYRILKPGASAHLFETYRDYATNKLHQALRTNLEQEGILRRIITPLFLKHQLKMTYSVMDYRKIIEESRFKHRYQIEKKSLGGLPIWLHIQLQKL